MIPTVLLAALIIFSLIGGGFSLAPWVPTRKRDFSRINKLANLKPGETFYELGCGDGRVCHAIAKLNPEAKVIGIEISPLLFLAAKWRQLAHRQKNLRIINKNLFHVDLSQADVVYVFGMGPALKKLHGNLKSNKRKPVRLISYSFPIEGSEAIQKDVKKGREITLREYVI